MLYRTGHDTAAAAARAAVDALQQAARDHAEAITRADHRNPDIIRPLRDPTEQQRQPGRI
ncbi:hypothetical protein GXW82_00625 [Streptacidiphilus sp. 4-A2]|nr:hypothetical protein [Streptacidiphilus sp. 4-A2]